MLDQSPLIHPFLHEDNKKTRRFLWWVVVLIILISAAGFGFWSFWSKEAVRKEAAISNLLKTTQELKEAVSLIPAFLGYDRPRTYLILFLNNAEIRPGGGFIGSYALIKLDKGRLISFETSGSENLDWEAPSDFKIEPPFPIKEYLRQPYWYFRDSNWSPDFLQSARTALWFYRFEGGREGSKIDGVIGLTPAVLAELLKITGPLTVNNKIYEAANVIEELQYQVEFGYKEEGKKRAERKVLIGDLGRALLDQLSSLSAFKWKDIYLLSLKMFKEKQLMVYSNDEATQAILVKQDWAGEVKKVSGDYLLVVDANLGSFKTDLKIKRSLHYQIIPVGDHWKGRVTILYQHLGQFDWKTTRYRTYTRIYAPAGSQLISSDGFVETDKIAKGTKPQAIKALVGEELNKTVFGGFLFIEPGQSKTLTVEYDLPDFLISQIRNGSYTLFVQKQLGALAPQLTIDLNFGKKIKPGGESIFHQETDLGVDREVEIEME